MQAKLTLALREANVVIGEINALAALKC